MQKRGLIYHVIVAWPVDLSWSCVTESFKIHFNKEISQREATKTKNNRRKLKDDVVPVEVK